MSSDDTISMPTGGLSGMKINAPANESFLNKAVSHLNRETQRGEHAPMVGGYKHDPLMR